MARYDPFTAYLQEQSAGSISLSFADIERIIGRKLPESAKRQRAFWSNNAANNVMTRAWLVAGFRSEQIDLPGGTVVFRREQTSAMTGFGETHVPFDFEEEATPNKFPLFGWMKGTITFAPDLDLTEPADPELGDLLDEIYGPSA